MNSGATIFDDRETVEFLRDHPHLLAIADAVRATQSKSRSASRRPRHPLIAMAAAFAVCAIGAALIAFLAVPGHSPHQAAITTVSRAGAAPASPTPLAQALRIASSSFGAPIILPDTSVLKPSDADHTAYLQWLPSPKPGEQEPVSQLDVQFSTSTPFVTIEYAPTAFTLCGSADASCGSVYPNALDQYKAEIAQGSQPSGGRTPPSYQIVNLSDGTTALVTTGQNGNDIEFRLDTLSINIWAPSNDGIPTTVDATALRALAQSMVDQTGNQ